MLAGLARDGGLYVPQTYPALTRDEIAGFAGRSYADVAQAVIAPYLGSDIDSVPLLHGGGQERDRSSAQGQDR